MAFPFHFPCGHISRFWRPFVVIFVVWRVAGDGQFPISERQDVAASGLIAASDFE
jgi:hypothetical protein